jgi:HAD superfamily hydrolase (TIGR01484 family)
MKYLALACDYDGTLAQNGLVSETTLDALQRVRASGRRLILVTGRQLGDLLDIFPRTDLFDRVVAENGAVLYRPASREEKLLAEAPPAEFVHKLREIGVSPLSAGKIIVATWEPNETAVVKVIHELGLELQVIFNKGAVMVLPSGVNKATGLSAALGEIGISAHNTAGIGDAENDHAFLNLCECSVAVANALAKLKERADFVTRGADGLGVVELIDELLASDLAHREPELKRHGILVGVQPDGAELKFDPFSESLLLAGPSGSGKSTLAMGLLERLAEQQFQFCIIDPEGDYESSEGAVVLGDSKREPGIEEVVALLEKPEQNVVVNLLGIALAHRPEFFQELLARFQNLRTRTGRPHFILIDETHHLLPSAWDAATANLPQRWPGLMLVTVHPEHVAPAALTWVDAILAMGEDPQRTIDSFSKAAGLETPPLADGLDPGEAWWWRPRSRQGALRFRIAPPRAERRRHQRKYAEGCLGPERSFYFQGPEGKLNLRAQNLATFLQLAAGVDEATWLYHLHRGDYSRWFREAIKDDALAAEASRIEAQREAPAAETRQRIKAEIEQRYTGPA